jgi:uncharacterized protein (TIGR03067 family)
MRTTLFGGLVLALTLSRAGADDKKDVPKELAPLQGTWTVVSVSFGGMPVPKDKQPDQQFKIEGDKLTVTEKGKDESGTVKVDAKKDPATIDLTSAKGEKMMGIYKIDKDGKLTLCVSFAKDARPKSFDDKDSMLLVLEKKKKK